MNEGHSHPPVAFSNSIRLSPRDCLGLVVFGAALVLLAPPLWEKTHPFILEPDYRMPYDLSNDYWLYERYSQAAAADYEGVVLGDSVVWGPYVTRQQTLAHYLNQQLGGARFANLGLNGAHPAALTGLIEYHTPGITRKTVVLQCNPLWLTSPLQDLQEESQAAGTAAFNHPDLVPQFSPWIPRYNAEMSKRIGVVVSRNVAFMRWTSHLQEAYYEQKSVPQWTLEHPYEEPAARLIRNLPPSDEGPREEPVPWFKRGRKAETVPWVDLETSLQWQSFQRAVLLLQKRGNRVFVLVGPYNEHMLTEVSRNRYHEIQATIVSWLEQQQVSYVAPDVLPRDEYGDASHPLAAGYDRLARHLATQAFFKE